MNNLIIVESPNKIQKIKSFLNGDNNSNWEVLATKGHIRDLSTYGTQLHLGLDLENMIPKYINLRTKKEEIDKLLKDLSKFNNIYIATDPDREGEAIGWHVVELIKDKKPDLYKKLKFFRITFNEITRKAVLESLTNLKELNLNLVSSQETRRILDRMIGFRLTSLSRNKIQAQSAGRVKSVVLKMIIDKENIIKDFKPEFWWTLNSYYTKEEYLKNVSSDKFVEIKYSNLDEAKKVKSDLSPTFTFQRNKKKKRVIKPPKPLEMASYLMSMFNVYGMSNSSANSASQSLYEKGFITYPRTDSFRISSTEFIKSISKHIESVYGANYFKPLPLVKNNKNSQDAHEAIRPTNINLSSSDYSTLKINERKAYDLILKTTIKAFMIEGVNINILNYFSNNSHWFSQQQTFIEELGFRKVDIKKFEVYKELEINELVIPNDKVKVIENKTNPPARYNPSSIIKSMKKEGIGRPSTYSNITFGLINYKYIIKSKGNNLIPTDLGNEINDLLINRAKFDDIINVGYTKIMEEKLDEISVGNIDKILFLKEFWKDFEPRIEKALEIIEKNPPKYIKDRVCPICGNKLEIKRGRFGEFISCSDFPNCKHTEKISKSVEVKLNPKEYGSCPKCKSDLVIRKSKFGTHFVGCTSFPECRLIMDKDSAKIIIDKVIKPDNNKMKVDTNNAKNST